MAILRVTPKLRRAFSLGAGFGVARRLLRGFSIDAITRWLVNTFGTLSERELLQLVDHGREMRDAGVRISDLTPGAVLDLNEIPVNPWLSQDIVQGSRAVTELIVPWQDTGTGNVGEWYWRIRSAAEPGFDEFMSVLDTEVVANLNKYERERLAEQLEGDIIIGGFTGVSSVRIF